MKCTSVIDIGSSKVSCCTISLGAKGIPTVRGFCSCAYSGYYLGGMPRTSSLFQAISTAVAHCEAESKQRISSVSIGIPASFTKTRISAAKLESRFGGARISEPDIDKLILLSSPMNPPKDYTLIHSTPFDYVVNGSERVVEPVGSFAQSLEASVSHIYADNALLKLLNECFTKLGISIELFAASSLTDAHYIIPEEMRRDGAVLIDCGGNVCDVSLIRNDAVFETISIGMGGSHITNDLAIRLRLSDSAADELKRHYGFYDTDLRQYRRVFVPNEGYVSVKNSVTASIIESRVKELAGHVSESIGELVADAADTPVYITGGGIAPLSGGIEFFSECIGLEINDCVPYSAFEEDDDIYGKISAYALADFILYESRSVARANGRLFTGIKQILTKKS